MVFTLHLYVVYGFEKKVTLPNTTSKDLFCIIEVESVHCAVRAESLNKTGTFFFERLTSNPKQHYALPQLP
jgi:hypothetical protein